MLIFLLIFFELILNLGGYFYFDIYSNLESTRIEKDSFRILFLGESTTAGTGAGGIENAYPAQVEKILQQEYPDKKIKCYNKGIGAVETTAILRNLDRNMIKYKPHLVIPMAGFCDYFAGYVNQFTPSKPSGLKMWYSRFKIYRLVMFIKDIFRLSSRVSGDKDFKYLHEHNNETLRYLHFALFYKPLKYPLSQVIFNLNEMIQTVHSYGSEIWFAGYLQPDAREKVNPTLEEIAKENNIMYVGDYPIVDFKINRSLFAEEDGWHPSKDGHRIIAEKIAEKVIQEGIIDHWNES